MVFCVRRSLIPLVLASVCIVILFLLQRPDAYYQGPVLRASTSSSTDGRSGTFRWGSVPVRHPIKALQAIPKGRKKPIAKVQYDFKAETDEDKIERLKRRDAVKEAFTRCYSSYRERAWLQDELQPISGTNRTAYGGWAATLVDSLDTLYIMGMDNELQEAIRAVASINFSNSTETHINVFETTIRYIGGFLAAYDLTGHKLLLQKAVEVGEMLLVAFDTPNHLPSTRWEWQAALDGGEQYASENAVVAEIGSFTMELTRLSQLTGDMHWYDIVARITALFDAQQGTTKIPGLWPVSVQPRGSILNRDDTFSLGAMADSLYEYFPKMHALLAGAEPIYRKLYRYSMEASIKHLLFRPMTPENHDILFAGKATVSTYLNEIDFTPEAQHLTCFVGGMFALGGKLFEVPEHVSVGRKLTDGCVWAYHASARGIMPEVVELQACESKDSCVWNQTVWEENIRAHHGPWGTEGTVESIIKQKHLLPGFTLYSDRTYLLRPEAIESVFILYRITGDKRLLDDAWKMFTAIESATKTEYGNAELDDVTDASAPLRQRDRMESFWMGETLKYFYLIFSVTDEQPITRLFEPSHNLEVTRRARKQYAEEIGSESA